MPGRVRGHCRDVPRVDSRTKSPIAPRLQKLQAAGALQGPSRRKLVPDTNFPRTRRNFGDRAARQRCSRRGDAGFPPGGCPVHAGRLSGRCRIQRGTSDCGAGGLRPAPSRRVIPDRVIAAKFALPGARQNWGTITQLSPFFLPQSRVPGNRHSIHFQHLQVAARPAGKCIVPPFLTVPVFPWVEPSRLRKRPRASSSRQ